MRIECEDLEDFIFENGWTEMFSQSVQQKPYSRARPECQLYLSLNKNYQNIIKQLADILPKETTSPKSDGFDAFVGERD